MPHSMLRPLSCTLLAICGFSMFTMPGCGNSGGSDAPAATVNPPVVAGDIVTGGETAPGGAGTRVDTVSEVTALVGADPMPAASTPAAVAAQANSAINGQLVTGTSYQDAAKSLAWAETKDPSNPSATFFRGAAEFLNTSSSSLVGGFAPAPRTGSQTVQAGAEGGLAALLTSLGVQIQRSGPSSSLFSITGCSTSHVPTVGNAIPNTAKTADAYVNWLRDDLRPRLIRLQNQWARVSADWVFDLALKMDANGKVLADQTAAGNATTRKLDYGDVCLFRAALIAQVAAIDGFTQWDLAKADPNAFDIDPLTDDLKLLDNAVRTLETAPYANAGRVNATRTGTAKELLTMAHVLYGKGMDKLRTRTGSADAYWLTLGRDTFDTLAEQQTWLHDETCTRALADGAVAAFGGTWSPDKDGKGVPIVNRFTVDFSKFFAGVDLREIYFKPLDLDGQHRILAVRSPADYTLQQATLGGVLTQYNGKTLVAADAQTLVKVPPYVAPTAIKHVANPLTIDGNLSDWPTDATVLGLDNTVANNPLFTIWPGSVAAVISTNYLYVRIMNPAFNQTADLGLPLGTPPGTGTYYKAGYEVVVNGIIIRCESYQFGINSSRYSSSNALVSQIAGNDGAEIAIPFSIIGNHGVRLDIQARVQQPTYQLYGGSPYYFVYWTMHGDCIWTKTLLTPTLLTMPMPN